MDSQKENQNIADHVAYALDNKILTDVQFAFPHEEGDQLLHAHKVIIACASPVFMRMFCGDFVESTCSSTPIIIEGISSEAFAMMLKYIYTDAIQLKSCESAIDVYGAAKKYMIDVLKEHCLKFVIAKLEMGDALSALKFANFHEEEKIREAALKLIRKQTSTLLKSPDFLKANPADMLAILEQEELEATELELFNALELLASANNLAGREDKHNKTKSDECCIEADTAATSLFLNFRQVVKKINFLVMTANQFASGPVFSKLLLPEESTAIFACLVDPINIKTRYPKDFTQNRRINRLPRVRFEITADDINIGHITIQLSSDCDAEIRGKFIELCTGKNQCGFKGGYFENIRFDSKIYRAIAVSGKEIFENISYNRSFIKRAKIGTVGLRKNDKSFFPGQMFIVCSETNIKANFLIGRVVEGMDVIKKFKAYATSTGDPSKEIRIEKCDVI